MFEGRAMWKAVGAPSENPDRVLWYQQAFRQRRAFSSQLQISPFSSAVSKSNQAKLTMYNLGENNFNELPMQKKWKLALSLVSCYHQ